MSRHPPRKFNADVHYMGDHPLFHNTSTVKLFPRLAQVPASELADLFHVPNVDPEEQKLRELMFHEPHYSSKEKESSSSATKEPKKPFIPVNAASAKEHITREKGSVFFGTPIDRQEEEKRAHREALEKQAHISEKPFGFGGKLEAAESIQSPYYVNSPATLIGSEAAQRVKEMTKGRIKSNREAFLEAQRRQQRPHGQ